MFRWFGECATAQRERHLSAAKDFAHPRAEAGCCFFSPLFVGIFSHCTVFACNSVVFCVRFRKVTLAAMQNHFNSNEMQILLVQCDRLSNTSIAVYSPGASGAVRTGDSSPQ